MGEQQTGALREEADSFQLEGPPVEAGKLCVGLPRLQSQNHVLFMSVCEL